MFQKSRGEDDHPEQRSGCTKNRLSRQKTKNEKVFCRESLSFPLACVLLKYEAAVSENRTPAANAAGVLYKKGKYSNFGNQPMLLPVIRK